MVVIVLSPLAAVALAACTAVPDSGPVRAGQQPAGQAANIHVNPRGPVPGSQPDSIVTGFRFANADTTEALGVAKAYLVNGATWQPSGAVVVADSGSPLTDVSTGPNTVTVKVKDNQIGQLAADGTYQPSPSGPPIEYDYQLTKDPKQNDQWRITNAPPTLVLTVAQIQSSYQAAYVYFLRPDEQMLVPVQVFLPVTRDLLAQELLTTLLAGPPAWLKPAVTTALPAGTAPGPTQINGVTTVDLPRGAATLSAAQRNAIAAQVAYTLSNPDPATRSQNFGELKILSGGQPLINGQQLQTALDWPSFDPDALNVNFYYSDSSHLTRDHLGRLVPGDTGELDNTPLLAPAVAPRTGADAADQLIAGVVQDDNGKDSLYAGPLLAPKQLLTGSNNFTTPSWDSLGNLWTVQQQQSSSAPRVLIAPSGKATLPAVAAPDLANKVIEELKVSRDGTRVAVLAVSTTGSQVLVGAVAKDGTTIENFYPVAPSLTSVTDFVWASSTKLDILDPVPNTNAPGTTSQLWSVDVDGWSPSLTQGTVLTDAVSIAAAPRQPLVVATSLDQIEQLSGGQWQFVGQRIGAALPRLSFRRTKMWTTGADRTTHPPTLVRGSPSATLAIVKVVGSVLELLLPSRCAGCGACDGAELRLRGLCQSCVAAVRESVPIVWELAVPDTRSVIPSFAAGAYDGVIRAALLDYKERGRLCLRRELGGCLAVSVFAAVGSDDSSVVLAPVPSATATRRARGTRSGRCDGGHRSRLLADHGPGGRRPRAVAAGPRRCRPVRTRRGCPPRQSWRRIGRAPACARAGTPGGDRR